MVYTHRVEPHLIDVRPVLVLGQLDTPLSTIFVRFIFPSRDNTLLRKASETNSVSNTRATNLKEVVISFLWKL